MAFVLRFVQRFRIADEKQFLELEKRFAELERQHPSLPKGRRMRPLSGRDPGHTLSWESEFDSLPALHHPNLLATIPGTGRGRRLLLNGHMDTVPAGRSPWTGSPWSGTIRNGRLFGRGSVDMKGGLAAALGALCAAPDHPWSRCFSDSASVALGKRVNVTAAPFPCDAFVVQKEFGIPTLLFGPRGGGAHNADEYVEIASVLKTAAVLLTAALE